MKAITLNITIPEAMLQELIQQEVRQLIRERATTLLDADPVFDTDEAATYLRISKATLYRKCSEGEIPYSSASGRSTFRKSELDEFLRSGKKATKADLDTAAANYLMTKPRRVQL